MTVVAFLIFPARTENFNVESLRGHAVTKSLRDTILEIQTKIGRRIYEICLRLIDDIIYAKNTVLTYNILFYRGRMPVEEELLNKEDTVRLKRCLYALQRDDLPPVTTHNVVNDWCDPVLNTIRRCKLFNTTSDKVKVR